MSQTRKSSSSKRKRQSVKHTKPLCVACTGLTGHGEEGFLTQETESIPAPWLQAIHRQAVPVHTQRFRNLADQGFPDSAPIQSDIRIRFSRSDPPLPKRVLYWGAGNCPVTCAGAIGGGAVTCAGALQGAERAYGYYKNMGIATRKGNTLEFVMQTPRPYVAQQRNAKKSQLWCRHVHFVDLQTVEGCIHAFDTVSDCQDKCAGGHHKILQGKKPKCPANNVLYTVAVFPRTYPFALERTKGKSTYTCTPLFHPETPHGQSYHHSMFIDFEQYLMAKAKGMIGINAIEDPEWPPIHESDIVINWKLSPDAIQAILSKKRILREQPLIVYCANEGCKAAQELLYTLTQLGYCNLFYFKHGMEEARNKVQPLQTFMTHSHKKTS